MSTLTLRHRLVSGVLVLALLFIVCPTAHATRHALLIGVGNYDNPVSALLAPPIDVSAVESVLLNQWGFDADRIHKVLDGDATKAGILGAMRQLEVVSEPGDFIFIYYAGHGTSALDVNFAAALPHTSGALVPADFSREGGAEAISQSLVVGRRDIRPILENLDRNGRKVFFAVDACYSGNTVRGASADEAGIPPLIVRSADIIAPEVLAKATAGQNKRPPEPYPYEQVFYLSASGEHEPAGEIDESLLKWYPTHDGKPHGAFTDAMLRAMKGLNPGTDANADGNITYLELFNSIRSFMDQRGYQQTPQFLPTLEEASVDLSKAIVFDSPGAIKVLSSKVKSRPVTIRLVAGNEQDQQMLARIKLLERVERQADLVLIREADEVKLVNASGDLILSDPDIEGRSIWDRVRAEVWLRLLTDSIAPAQGSNLTLQYSGDAMGATAVQGDTVGFVLASERPSYVVIFDVNARGGISLLYPYFDREKNQLNPGQLATIPDTMVVPPFGVDKIVAVAYASQLTGIDQFMRQTMEPGEPALESFKQLLSGQGDALASAQLQLITMASTSRSLERQGGSR